MFEITIEVAEELHKLNEKKFVPKFYKDYKFRKYVKEFTSNMSLILNGKVIDYGIITDLFRFYINTYQYILDYDRVLPLYMINGMDVISVMYKIGSLKCDMRYNSDNDIDVTQIYTYRDNENPLIERQEKSTVSYTRGTLPGHIKVRLIDQIIKYITLYMTLVYEYGVEENETDIH